MIHYSHFAARGAARAPLLLAAGSLAVIAGLLGEPQAGAGTPAVAGALSIDQPANSAPILRFGPRPDRVHNGIDPAAVAPEHGPAATPHLGLALFNRDRMAAGLPPLSESKMLDVIAATRAQQMTTDGLTHVRPGNTVMAVTQLLRQNGVSYTWDGENIFWSGGPPFDDALTAAESWWMSSPEHRDNVLGLHFRQVGIGTAIDGGKMYISAVFTD
ncbi:MAG TPA: CAP domain-containing protein [Candidatus Dormibacteraeota bacterium]